MFETHASHFSFALFYYIFPKIRPILFKESWFTNFSQLLPSRAIFRLSNWATADILHIVPSMSNFVKFFGSLLKMALLVYKCCDFCGKTDFWVQIFHNHGALVGFFTLGKCRKKHMYQMTQHGQGIWYPKELVICEYDKDIELRFNTSYTPYLVKVVFRTFSKNSCIIVLTRPKWSK